MKKQKSPDKLAVFNAEAEGGPDTLTSDDHRPADPELVDVRPGGAAND
ncbi:MAG: hypothetical protein ABI473_06530 [Candidatus Dormibacter sp.]